MDKKYNFNLNFDFNEKELTIYVDNIKDELEINKEIDKRWKELVKLLTTLVSLEAKNYLDRLYAKGIDLPLPLEYTSSLNIKLKLYLHGKELRIEPLENIMINKKMFIIKKKTKNFLKKKPFLFEMGNDFYITTQLISKDNSLIVNFNYNEEPRMTRRVPLSNFKRIETSQQRMGREMIEQKGKEKRLLQEKKDFEKRSPLVKKQIEDLKRKAGLIK